jgi:putative alpha-1,2-mannosidase
VLHCACFSSYRRFGVREMVAEVRMATSFISAQQARSNLEREMPLSATFDHIKAETEAVWNK